MFQHILVPLDGSLRAERTLPIAARLAQASQGNLILLRVVEASAEENAARSGPSSLVHQSVCAQLDEAQQYLAALARAREIAGIPLTIEVHSGPVVSTILAAAQTSQADLLILCEQDGTQEDDSPLAGLAGRCLEQITIPLLLVPAHGNGLRTRNHPVTLLVALDQGQPDRALLEPASALLAALAVREQGRSHEISPCSLRALPASSIALNLPADQRRCLHQNASLWRQAPSSTLQEKQNTTGTEMREGIHEGDLLVLGMPPRPQRAQWLLSHRKDAAFAPNGLPLLLVPLPVVSQSGTTREAVFSALTMSHRQERADSLFERLLVSLDGSQCAEQAIPLAARLARGSGGSVVLMHVIPPASLEERATGHAPALVSPVERAAQALQEASTYLASVLTVYAEELRGICWEIQAVCGQIVPSLVSTAHLEQADLVVMCRHRETGLGQWGSESLTQQAIHQQLDALLILKEQGMELQPDRMQPLRVVVPLDGSLLAEGALEPALCFLARFPLSPDTPGELHLVRVVTDPGTEYEHAARYLHAIQERLIKDFHVGEGCLVTSSVAVGDDIAEALLEQVQMTGYTALMAMATHSREGMPRLAGGSITERVLDAAPCPLLIVHPGGNT